ncbi:MAG: TAXI family TRAP transporter solute-binding subunit [Deltaproteobacteria bacterium]|nr:TAXI family TRAP transporter solute-binding subunit [Deltaproteobacteria bacterium]MBW2152744.1 TAXI family TRAP transporter solute-binding subunit [Deltaproteobacteria bacterium]
MIRSVKHIKWLFPLGLFMVFLMVPSVQAVTLKAAAGGTGGGWYQAFSQLAQLVKEKDPSIDIKVVPGGGLANPPRVDAGEVQLGFAFPPFINAASKGKKPYKKAHPNIRTVAGGFGLNPLQFVITKDTGIKSIEEIVQKKFPLKFAADRVGTTDEWSCRTVLEFYKVTYEDIKKWGGKVMHLGYGDIETQIKDRNADATFVMIAPPASIITSISISRPIRLLEFSEELRNYLVNEWSFSPAIIKAGTYKGQDRDVQTVALFTTIMANKDVADDVIYRITKIILENPDRVRKISPAFKPFDPTKAGIGTGGQLHPGALKFYKEKGWIK